MNGAGKTGFHDNSDSNGQDATYLTPDWLNTIQEELANLLELRGITLDPVNVVSCLMPWQVRMMM